MIKSIVSLEPDVYKMLPDLAMCDDGSLVCVYRESLVHGRWPFSRIVCQISRDGGRNWGQKSVVAEISDSDKDGGWNTPRLLHLGGQRLLMVCDWGATGQGEYTPNSETYSWHSEDGGDSWTKVNDLLDAQGDRFGLPRRRGDSVVLASFNIRNSRRRSSHVSPFRVARMDDVTPTTSPASRPDPLAANVLSAVEKLSRTV